MLLLQVLALTGEAEQKYEASDPVGDISERQKEEMRDERLEETGESWYQKVGLQKTLMWGSCMPITAA